MQDQTFGVINDHPEAPFLPGDFVVLNRETSALRLSDFHWLQVVSEWPIVLDHRFNVIVAAFGSERPLSKIFDVQHFQTVDVHMNH